MVCDAVEKYFAPTLIGGVGVDGSGCEQGMWSKWFAMRVKKCFASTLISGVGADCPGCEQGARW